MKPTMRRVVALGAAAALLPCTLSQAQLIGSTETGAGLAAAGPVSPLHHYPEYYEDTLGMRLQPCLTNTGNCLLPGPVNLANPNLAFPDNYGGTFPDEWFYWSCDADMATNGGGSALLILALEGSFTGAVVDGTQIVFGRVRIRIDNLIAGQTYEVTTPVGVYTFVAENSAARGINFTDDVGTIELDFLTPLDANLGPFLTWDSELPIVDNLGNEYIGDPNVLHTITGSATPFFRVEGPSVGPNGEGLIETNLFAVSGLLAAAGPPPAPPVANFSAAPTSGTVPLDVAFTDLSTDATGWSWSFGDGGTSNLQNPSHTYLAPGTYTVALTATGPGGSDVNTMPGLIVVNDVVGGASPTLLPGDPGVAGMDNAFTVINATPGGRVIYFMSQNLGMQNAGGGGCNVVLGILKPRKLGATSANAGGIATLVKRVPSGFAGKTAHLQAVDIVSCTVTNIVSQQF